MDFSGAARRAAGYRFGAVVPLAVAVLGLALLVGGQLVPDRHGMEHNLTDRSNHALSAAGLTDIQVSFTGRDGTLHAPNQADADKALAIVRALDGVRVAHAVVDAAPPVSTPPTVSLVLVAGKLTLTGTVPTADAKAALEKSAGTVFGAGNVTDSLTVDASVTAAGLAGLTDVLSAFGTQTTDATAKLGDGTLTLTGTVTDQPTKDAVEAAAGKAVGAAHVVDNLTVKAVQQQLIEIPPITFVTGSATLTPEGQAALANAAAVLNAHPAVRIRIEGNTDSNGSAASNLALSQARAQTVLDTLAGLGVARDRMESVGYGETRPKVPDNSPANQAINRRVDFVVLQ